MTNFKLTAQEHAERLIRAYERQLDTDTQKLSGDEPLTEDQMFKVSLRQSSLRSYLDKWNRLMEKNDSENGLIARIPDIVERLKVYVGETVGIYYQVTPSFSKKDSESSYLQRTMGILKSVSDRRISVSTFDWRNYPAREIEQPPEIYEHHFDYDVRGCRNDLLVRLAAPFFNNDGQKEDREAHILYQHPTIKVNWHKLSDVYDANRNPLDEQIKELMDIQNHYDKD